MKPVASVVLCTHNPQPTYLQRVLDALRDQTLPLDQWELLLIDNASETALGRDCNLCWHPSGRHIREDKLGLSFARVKGVNEARGELIVFLDDDNILDRNYLATAKSIMQDKTIGALGGAASPIFEENVVPPAYFYNVATWLACGAQFGSRDSIGKEFVDLTELHDFSLFGAGLVVRRSDMTDLLGLPDFPSLSDRMGTTLSSGGDYEICYLIALKGKRIGYSAQLRFEHIIPEFRLEPSYLLRLSSTANAAQGRVIENYAEARKFYSKKLSKIQLMKNIAKVILLRHSYTEAFSLGLLLGSSRVVAAVDRPVFRNVLSVKRLSKRENS